MFQPKISLLTLYSAGLSLLIASSAVVAIEKRDLEQPWQKQVREMEEKNKSDSTRKSDKSNTNQKPESKSNAQTENHSSEEETNGQSYGAVDHDDTRDHPDADQESNSDDESQYGLQTLKESGGNDNGEKETKEGEIVDHDDTRDHY